MLMPSFLRKRILPYDAKLICDSFKTIRPRIEEYSPRFYEHFWRDYPETAPLFGRNMPRVELDTRINHFMLYITQYADRPHLVIDFVRELGKRHVGYRIKKRYFAYVNNTNIKTLRDFLGPDFTPELEKNWRSAFEFLTLLMLWSAPFSDD
jgi:nitric oxide dioxygenase